MMNFIKNAVDYYQYFLENEVEMYISTITIAEYSVIDDPTNLPLRTLKIIPFDYLDGVKAGKIHAMTLQMKNLLADIPRNVIKDDSKLMAQLINRQINSFATSDKKVASQLAAPILQHMETRIVIIDITIPLATYKGTLF